MRSGASADGRSGDEGDDHEQGEAGEDGPDQPFQERQIRFDLEKRLSQSASAWAAVRASRRKRRLLQDPTLIVLIAVHAPGAIACHIAPTRADVCVPRRRTTDQPRTAGTVIDGELCTTLGQWTAAAAGQLTRPAADTDSHGPMDHPNKRLTENG